MTLLYYRAMGLVCGAVANLGYLQWALTTPLPYSVEAGADMYRRFYLNAPGRPPKIPFVLSKRMPPNMMVFLDLKGNPLSFFLRKENGDVLEIPAQLGFIMRPMDGKPEGY